MNSSQDTVQLLSSRSLESADQRTQRLTAAGVILMLVMILFFTEQWSQRDSHVEGVTSTDHASAVENVVAFDYFSAQFGSPAPAQGNPGLVMQSK